MKFKKYVNKNFSPLSAFVKNAQSIEYYLHSLQNNLIFILKSGCCRRNSWNVLLKSYWNMRYYSILYILYYTIWKYGTLLSISLLVVPEAHVIMINLSSNHVGNFCKNRATTSCLLMTVNYDCSCVHLSAATWTVGAIQFYLTSWKNTKSLKQ